MAFDPGTRIGPYQIAGRLGAGGMGEVYRARDMRLDRTVAIKVLNGALAADSESRLRFEQEARAIAALNDPGICVIHDIGRHGELDYLVLEYLEGDTLADRLARAPLPIADVLAIAIQIGDALERAHRAGIVHRDLKPANVMLVGKSGASSTTGVKLLDFGLAARTSVVSAGPADTSLAATLPPSLDVTRPPSATAAPGFSGTLQYMAPESLTGGTVDHRADIFAFGCVLYEMLAQRKAFEGTAVATVIAAITNTDPAPVAALSDRPFLDHVMRRCLERAPERRWQDIGDVTGELRWIAAHPVVPGATSHRPARSRVATLALTAMLLAAAAAAGAAVANRRGHASPAAVPTLRFEIPTAPTDDPSMALSPDGRQIAFVADRERVPVLWIRALDGVESRSLPGTEGARYPFWSPDGRSIGFFADDKLKRIEAGGGTPLVVTDAPTPRGGTWNAAGMILFTAGVAAPVMRVPARGGAAESVTQINAGAGPSHRFPQFLPDGKRFLFSSTLGTADTDGVYLGSLDKTTPVRLVPRDGVGRFAAPDKLLTINQSALQAYTFDTATGRVQGEPVLVAEGFTGAESRGAFATSDTGVLAYRAAGAQRRQLVWVNRQGTILRAIGEPEADAIASPELSPDEESVAVFLQRTGDNDIWVIELARNLARRITDGPPADAHPLWDPDGQHLVFQSQRFSGGAPARQPLSGGKPEPLLASGETGQALSWTRDRGYVLIRRGAGRGSDLIAVATTGTPRQVPVAQSQYDESEGQFSPDGKSVAFVSNEGGRPEVFVQSFPEAQSRVQASTAGGTQVRWSSDGRELFYVARDGKMMAVSITPGGGPAQPKLPVALFQTHLASGINVIGNKPQYAVARDGRFLLDVAVESVSSPIIVTVNWMAKLGK